MLHIRAPNDDVLALVRNESNGWFVDENYQVYRDAKLLNERIVMTLFVTLKWRVLTRSLHTVTDVHNLFTPTYVLES